MPRPAGTTSAQARSLPRPRRRRRTLRLLIEPLEDRLMLDAAPGSPPAAIVAGRTLSAYTVGAVQNNQVTITYTVYNEQADPETGVLLTTTLAPGVTLSGASVQPERSGQNLAWSLGTIGGFDRASVSVTVTLASPAPTALDSGAQAYATLDAAAVTDSAPAATLRAGTVDPGLLASTPDANTTDPFVQEAAARLDYDPQRIFDFLHSEVGYNAYTGSVRGARGTLWSDAGNALDVASLGVALMRASGIPAQYVQGTLPFDRAQQLILSMFPASDQTLGVVTPGNPTANPASDSQLLTQTEDHAWFQFDTGSGMTDADPLMAGAVVGQTFTSPTGTFGVVPDTLREKTQVQLVAETYTQASALFGVGDGLSTTVVLDQTFNDVDLVGRPLTIGQRVSSSGGGFLFTVVTNTYSPYLELGDEAYPDPRQDETLAGTPIQETLTNFPFGSVALTGLVLRTTLSGPQAAAETDERTLFDRIGYAQRRGLAPVNIAIDPTGQPALNPFDLWTLNAQPSIQSHAAAAALQDQASRMADELDTITPNSQPASQPNPLYVAYFTALTRLYGANFLDLSDGATAATADVARVLAYPDRPRLILTSTGLTPDASGQTGTLTTRVDLRRDALRALAGPGQNPQAAIAFNATHGLLDNHIETAVIPTPPPPSNGIAYSPPVSTERVVQAAVAQGVPLVLISAETLPSLDTLMISAAAKARITAAVQAGRLAIVPARSVDLDGKPAIAWYEMDTSTGETIGVTEDGGHQSLSERTTLILAIAAIGFISFAFPGSNPFLKGLGKVKPPDIGAAIAGALRSIGNSIQQNFGLNYQGGLPKVLNNMGNLNSAASQADPPLDDLLYGPLPDSRTASATAAVASTAGLAAGQTVANHRVGSARVAGSLVMSWTGLALNASGATALSAAAATVRDAQGNLVGTGTAALTGGDGVALAVAGLASYHLQGTGGLSFYGPAETPLGVGGEWQGYAATVSGSVTITLTTAGLVLNGTTLPAGTYTVGTASATFSGGGTTAAPNFAGSVAITATGAAIELGPGTGSLSAGGSALDPHAEVTLTGYTGTVTVTANGDGTDTVGLNGNAARVLTVLANPVTLSADQNTPATFQASITTSLADQYTLTANAPPGWLVSIDASGKVTVTPAAGLQAGTFPVQLIARSTTDPNLVAQNVVNVTVTPTQPGVVLSLTPDPQYSVPFNGARLPLGFRATIQNLGPAADTYNLTFSNVPAGFTLLRSTSSVTVPAGQTGIVGLYLVPNAGQALPAPSTQLSFGVTATSTTASSMTQTQTETFTVPAIEAVTVVVNPIGLATTPGTAVTATVTVTNAGNVAEQGITLAAALPAGLSLSGLAPLTLAPGASATETITLTPDASTAIGSVLAAPITATFGPSGSPRTSLVTVPLLVVAPGVQAVNAAVASATQGGNTNLADRLSDLSGALTRLFQAPTDPVAKSQATASLDSLITQTSHDPFLASFTAGLTAARAAVAASSSAADVQTALTNLGTALGSLATAVADEAAHGFTLGLEPARIVVQPNVPAVFSIDLKNTGSQVTTYDLDVSGLAAGVTASFSQTKITLQPGQQVRAGSGAPTLSLTEAGSSLTAAGFTIIATAEGAPEITNTTQGALTLRDTFLQVATVSANPPFVATGATGAAAVVEVSARVQSALNQPQADSISFAVLDPTGNPVFTSAALPLPLDPTSALVTADLGPFDTTGLPQGNYTLVATIADASGQPIPGSVGRGSLVVGLPVTADISTTPVVVPTGTDTVTTTIHVHGTVALPSPLNILGQVNTGDNNLSTVLFGNNLAYEVGNNGISIVDVSDRTNPTVLSTFATDTIVKGGFNIAQVVGDKLLVASTVTLNASGFNFIVYDLTDPLNPTLVSNTPLPFRFFAGMFVLGNVALFPLEEFDFFPAGANTTYFAQSGNVLSVDISDLTHPKVLGTLFPSNDPHPENGAVIVNSQVAYTLTTGNTGGDTSRGPGRLLLLDISNPAAPKQTGSFDIPGTNTLTNIALQGNRALVVGSSGGLLQPFNSGKVEGFTGNVTLTELDISDPANPKVLGDTLVTEATSSQDATLPPGRRDLVDLGNGLFALSSVLVSGKPALLLIDASDPNNIVVSAVATPALDNGLTVSGNTLYVSTPAGLATYDIGTLVSQPVTVSVQVPKDAANVNLVAGSFDKPPTQIIAGANSDTYVWNRSLAFGNTDLSFSWKTTLKNLATGDTRSVTLAASVGSVSQGTPVALALAGTSVTAASIIGVSPASQTEPPGGSATYIVRLTNPLPTPVTYNVFATSPSGATALLERSNVAVAGNSSTDIVLTITSNPTATAGSVPFTVTATNASDGGVTGSAQASLTIAGTPIPRADTRAHGVVAVLTPAEATAGQGTEARYVVRVTNTGSAEDSFSLSISGLPQDVTASFSDPFLDIPPGAGNFRDVVLVLTTSLGTAAGRVPFTVTATDGASATGSAGGTLVVVNNGVSVSLSPSSGAPGSPFQANITNTGTVADTFDLALGGPAALVASLGSTQVTLAPGASQTVPITTQTAGFALPGSLNLMALATSHTNPAVKDFDLGSLAIPPIQGLTAQFAPASQTLTQPGTATFTLTVKNTGNSEDSYEAVIVGTQGPILAHLIGVNGRPTTTIPEFFLPALGTGVIQLQASLLAALQQGLITVMIRSLTNSSIAATATATVTASATVIVATGTVLTVSPTGPVIAGQPVTLTATVHSASGGSIPTGTVTFVDGSRVLGTVRLDAGGHARLTLSTAQAAALAARATALGVGTHTIIAVYHGDATHTGSRSAATTVVVRPRVVPTSDGPRVTSLLRYGYHVQPTVLVLQFNRALNVAAAENARNYTIVSLGGPGRSGSRVGQHIPVRKAVYDPTNLSVTLYPTERLDVHNRYQLTVNGATAGGLTDTSGRLLDGQGTGRPGSNFVSLITRQTLAGPVSATGVILQGRTVKVPAVSPSAIDLLASLGKLSVKTTPHHVTQGASSRPIPTLRPIHR